MDQNIDNMEQVSRDSYTNENLNVNNSATDVDMEVDHSCDADTSSSKFPVDEEIKTSKDDCNEYEEQNETTNKIHESQDIAETKNNESEHELEKSSELETKKEETKTKEDTKEIENKVEPVQPVKKLEPNACEVCYKKVYPMEQLMMDCKVYHKTCFRCAKCGKSLSPTVVTKLNDKLFCKPHYIELFRKRGRYDDIENMNTTDKVDGTCINYSANESASVATSDGDDKKPYVSAKHLVAQFQEAPSQENSSRRPPIDIGLSNTSSVSQMTKNWGSSSTQNNSQSREWAADELDSVSKNAPVKNLRSKFENN